MDAHVRQRRPNRAKQPEVLNDDRVNTSGPCLVDDVERFRELVLQHHDVDSQVHTRSAEMREAARVAKGLEREVLGTSPGVQPIDAQIDGICAVCYRGSERFLPSRGCEKLRCVVGKGEHATPVRVTVR